MSDKLALPEWKMGQVLLPEQFLALQDTLLGHVHRRNEIQGLPAHGLARLRWDQELLATGSVAIHGLTWVLPSGRLLDVPSNAVVSTLDVADAAKGRRQLSLFLHVRNRTLDSIDHVLYGDDEPEVRRVLYSVEISTQDKHDDARESLKLAELELHDDGSWRVGSFCPPLLSTGPRVSPFLREELEAQERTLRKLANELEVRRSDAFRGTSQLSALPQAQVSAYRVLALLADLGVGEGGMQTQQEVWLHPYRLFCTLRDFFVELSVLQGLPLRPWPIRYEHLHLATCFASLREQIASYESRSRLLAPRLSFDRKGHLYVARVFPEDLCRASRVYLVVRPGSASLEGVRLASPQRIEEVVKRSLTGVRMSAMESGGLAYSYGYGRDVAFYELLLGGGREAGQGPDEWGSAVAERALCFQARAGLEGLDAALVWGA